MFSKDVRKQQALVLPCYSIAKIKYSGIKNLVQGKLMSDIICRRGTDIVQVTGASFFFFR